MSDILCVTHRQLCREDFLERVEKIAAARPRGLILREKDLPEEEYRALARRVLEICRAHEVPCILHNFPETARELGCEALHLPLAALRKMTRAEREAFPVLGASCHSREEAEEAEEMGCRYITLGHIFETACKQGLPGRGTELLQNVCAAVSLPVYAIGGINRENIGPVRRAGAAGACLMSGLMTCEDPKAYLKALEEKNEIG